jgi:hydrogenase/urease accessory protein HupE
MIGRTLGLMKGHLATLLGGSGAVALLASTASAHPGHSPVDVTAQLAAPLAGADHLFVFAAVSVIAALGAARLALHLIERRKRAMARTRRTTVRR